MYLDLVGLWRDLQHALPGPLALGVFALLILTVAALLIMPIAMMSRSELGALRSAYRHDRERLRDRAAGGAGAGELTVRRALLCLELVNRTVGHGLVALTLVMVVTQFAVVVLRYVFAFGSIPMQESIWYLHAILFMLGCGYALLMNAHVRVDIVYAQAGWRYRSLVDLLGSAFLVLPLCAVTGWLGWDYVANAWSVREGSAEVGGLPYLYLLKSVILAFALLVAFQAVAAIIRSTLRLAGLERDEEAAPSLRVQQ